MATGVLSRPDDLRVSARTHRRRALLLLAVAVWSYWVWGTRIRNLIGDADQFSTAFVGVHAVLYVVSLALAVALTVVGVRMWREAARTGASGEAADAESARSGPA